MGRRPCHFPSLASLLVCVAASVLWARSGGAGDRLGWKRQRQEGRNWVREEWSVRSGDGRLQFAGYRKASGPTGGEPPRAQIRFGEDGFFWKGAVETQKVEARQKVGSEPSAAHAGGVSTRPVAESSIPQQSGPPFALINETTPSLRVRGIVLPHWVIALFAALLPARWAVLAVRRGRDGSSDGDRVPLLARLFGTVASVSILIALSLSVLWLKSWYLGDRVSWRDARRPQFVDIHSGKGQIVFHFRRVPEKLVRSEPDLASAPNGLHWRQDAGAGVGYTPKTFCFEHEREQTRDGASRALTVAAPFWFLVVLALVPPVLWVRRQRYGPINVMDLGGESRARGHRGHRRGSAPSVHVNRRPI